MLWLLAAAVITATVITTVITAAADEKKDYDKNPSAVITAKRIATHISHLLSTTSSYVKRKFMLQKKFLKNYLTFPDFRV